MNNDILVLLDNGHGTPVLKGGKLSPDGALREPVYNREIVRRLENKLKASAVNVRIIVPETTDIPLGVRTNRVNAICRQHGAKNCLLVSVHVNAGNEGDPKTFVAKDKYGSWKTCRGWCGMIAPNASADSKKFAQLLYAEAEAKGLKGNRWVPPERYWVQSFAMTRDTNCPAVLTENLYQDNREDVAFLLSELGINTIVDIHYNAIMKYRELKSRTK